MTIEEIFKKHRTTVYIFGAAVVVIILFSVYMGAKISAATSYSYVKKKQYSKIISLYEKLEKCNETKNLFKGNLLSFVQLLKRENHLGGKILSVTPLLNQERETIEIKLKMLNLREFLNLVIKIGSYNNLDIKQFALTKDFTNPTLLDMDLAVERTE